MPIANPLGPENTISHSLRARKLVLVFAANWLLVRTIYYLFFRDHNGDLSNLWSAACLARYGSGALCDISLEQEMIARSVLRSYPPWAIPYFFWMAYFTKEAIAPFMFHVSLCIFSACGVVLTFFSKPPFYPKGADIFLLVSALSLSYPVYYHLTVGQLEVFQLIFFIFFMLLTNLGIYRCAGFFLGLTAIKPQALFLIYGYILINSFRNSNLRRIAVSAAITVAISAVVGWYLRSVAVTGAWPLQRVEVTTIYQPNIASYLGFLWQGHVWVRFVPLIIALVSLIVVSFKLQFSEKLLPVHLLLLTPASLLFSPYINIYDFIFFIPPLVAYLMHESITWKTYRNVIVLLFLSSAVALLCHYHLRFIHLFAWMPVVYFWCAYRLVKGRW